MGGIFGYQEIGPNLNNIAAAFWGMKVTATAAGTAISITAYLSAPGGTDPSVKVKCALYENTGTLMAETEEIAVGTATAWQTFNFPNTSPSISTTAYYMFAWADDTATMNTISISTGNTGATAGDIIAAVPGEFYDGTFTASLNPANIFDIPNNFNSIYCTYSQAHQKALSESLAIIETLVKKEQKVSSDNIDITETIIKNEQKVQSENIDVTESIAKYSQKIIIDNIDVTEILSKQAQKVLAELLGITETIVKLASLVKSEDIQLTEIPAKSFFKVLADSVDVTETEVKNFFKKISESIGVTENITLAGLTYFIATRYITSKIKTAPHELEAIKRWIKDLSYQDKKEIRKLIKDITSMDKEQMHKDYNDLMKDF